MMNKLLYLLISLCMLTAYTETNLENQMTLLTPIGQRYIEFLLKFSKNRDPEAMRLILAPDAKKVVNSRVICTNRDQIFQQMIDINDECGFLSLEVHQLIESVDKNVNVLRWEITYGDNTTESVITVITSNNEGQIVEINEVFGNKEVYNWPE